MPYAILRFEKRKGGTATAIEKHHEREKQAYKSNKDIDIKRSAQNYHIKAPQNKYYYEVQSRIEAAKCKVRRDSIKFVDTFIGGTHEFIVGLSKKEQSDYFQHAYNFISDQMGEKNIFSAIVHMDEATPHLHLCFVPLTTDNRLSAKEILGNRERMVKWQDDFYSYMVERYPTLERGEPAAETKRKHIPVRLYKQAKRLDERMDEIKAAISQINILNAGKKRDEAFQIISKWLPDAENFTAQVKTVDDYIRRLEQGNKAYEQRLENENDLLKEQISDKDDSLLKYKSEVYHLQAAIRQQKRLLNKIPAEVLEQIKSNKYKNIQR